jgi:molecular chaperone HtpG
MSKHTKKFKTEVKQLLDLVIHSLYSKKEIFLRELISNASDAIDRAKFEALTNKDIHVADGDWKIKIIPDKENRTLTISDNGIGMTAAEVESNIGTIANSGTSAYLRQLQENKDTANAEFIGQFGVGFYSAFMVADQVTVTTRRAGSDAPAVRWVSDGEGKYTIEECEKDSAGTDVTLHLRDGMESYLDEWEIRRIVKEYSDYISFPVTMDVTRSEQPEQEGKPKVEKTEEETLNSMKSIWKQSKSEISEEEYKEFYKHVSHDYADPLEIIHFNAEGVTEFNALLYIPSQAPFDMFMRESQHGLHLYVKNVFITDDCKELLPEYLRFVRGVVDSSDLPLNVSRETLQDEAIIHRIRKSLVGRILKTLQEMQEQRVDDYRKFHAQFGQVLKEGVHSDYGNRDKIADLLLFPSTASEPGAPTSLRDYVDRMPEGQADIFYLSGDDLKTVRNSPHLEAFRQRGYEVLFFTDPVDEWVANALNEYDGRQLKAVDRGEIELDGEERKAERDEERKAAAKEYKPLIKQIEKQLDEELKEVRISERLTDSPCCLVVDEHAMNAHMERIMRAMHQEVPKSKRILELNPEHELIKRMKGMAEQDKQGDQLSEYIELLYNQALLSEGSAPEDPARFAKLLSKLMVGE